MQKRIQNKVAESRLTLPAMSVYAGVVWFLAGLIGQQLWMQLACFVITTFLMVELNNGNALIRIYSRMVSSSFLALSCAASYLFPLLGTQLVTLCFVAMYVILFRCYQDKQSPGWTFYAFLVMSMASLVFPQLLYYVPLLWLLMAVQLYSMSWRTFLASVIGLLTPYWVAACYFAYTVATMGDSDAFAKAMQLPKAHLMQLLTFSVPPYYGGVTLVQALLYAFVVLLAITGMIHFLRNSIDDKIRIRQFYGCFMVVDAFTLTFLALQPQHYAMLMPIAIVSTAPLTGHFLALTHTKLTNVVFFVVVAVCLALAVLSLWMPSLPF